MKGVTPINEGESWKMLLLLLKKIAQQKHITNMLIAERTGMKQSNVNRMLNAKFPPTLVNFMALAKAIGVNFFFEDQEGTSDLNKAFEDAMTELGRRADKLPNN